MKKQFSFVLAAVLCLSLLAAIVGCDNGDAPVDTTAAQTQEPTEQVTEQTTQEITTEEVTIEETTTEGELNVEGISKGSCEGNVYKNEFLGFEFTRPDSWVFATDEEIAAAVNLGVDQFFGDNFKEALKNNPAIYDMMVVDSITRSNIGVSYENLSMSFASNITEEQYVEALKHQFSLVSGMQITFPKTLEKANLGKTEFTKCVCQTTSNGVSMTQVFYLRNIDGYMAVVVVTVTSGYTVADIEAMFK